MKISGSWATCWCKIPYIALASEKDELLVLLVLPATYYAPLAHPHQQAALSRAGDRLVSKWEGHSSQRPVLLYGENNCM